MTRRNNLAKRRETTGMGGARTDPTVVRGPMRVMRKLATVRGPSVPRRWVQRAAGVGVERWSKHRYIG